MIKPAQVIVELLADDGLIPNNPLLPLLVYQGALSLTNHNAVSLCEAAFAANGWGSTWRNGIYPYHHYHSTAHEALLIAQGEAEIQLGGEHGVRLAVKAGDAIIIPAGVGHKRLKASADLLVIGAYPPNQRWDLLRDRPDDYAQGKCNIALVPLPTTDPIFGSAGPLLTHWRA